jgi:MFS family permease
MVRQKFAWVVFAACCLLSFVGFGLTVNTAGLFWTSVSDTFGASRAEIALTNTIIDITSTVSLAFAGILFERVNTKVLLTASFAITGFAYVALSFAPSLGMIYVGMVMVGLVRQIAFIMPLPILLGNWFKKNQGITLGIAGAMTALGGSIWSPVVSHIITNSGWRRGYLFIGVVVLIVLIPVGLFMVRYAPVETVVTDEGATVVQTTMTGVRTKTAIKSSAFALFLLAFVALRFVAGLIGHLAPIVQSFGYELTVGAGVVSVMLIGAAVGKAIIGTMLDHIDGRIVVLLFAVVGGFGWYALSILSGGQLRVAGLMVGLGQGIIWTGLPILVRVVFGDLNYPQIFSYLQMVGIAANAIGTTAFGVLYDRAGNYDFSLTLAVGLYLIAGIAATFALIAKKRLAGKWVSSDAGRDSAAAPVTSDARPA